MVFPEDEIEVLMLHKDFRELDRRVRQLMEEAGNRVDSSFWAKANLRCVLGVFLFTREEGRALCRDYILDGPRTWQQKALAHTILTYVEMTSGEMAASLSRLHSVISGPGSDEDSDVCKETFAQIYMILHWRISNLHLALEKRTVSN